MVEQMQSQQKCNGPGEGRKRVRNNVFMPISERNAEPKEHLKVLEGQMCTLLCSIRAQHQALENAHSELEAERNASATAIDEAMNMISKLQAEKARLELEASQFQREAEQKMAFAEQALAFYESLLLCADEEIKFLQSEIQTYRLRYGICDNESTGNVPSLPVRADAQTVECCESDRMKVPFTPEDFDGSKGKAPMSSSQNEALNQDFSAQTENLEHGNQDYVGLQDETFDKECVEYEKYEVTLDDNLSAWDQFQEQSDALHWKLAEDDSIIGKAGIVCNPTGLRTREEDPQEDMELIKHVIAPVQDKVAQETFETKEEPPVIVKRPPYPKSAALASFTKALIVGLFLGSLKNMIANRRKRC
ncbi:hypothetical protein SUGI_1001330 [Cryptomeria japonica]|uniref:probable myosin-binding protein 6 n=1 Tax=Cryptomeria japonica TaxID=3369 RepID=UPI002414C425|nr:probable myosin-binding protein 6 [Cryptomeria japonica]XP_057817860.2 probable myosin-binding protein 6 [Cryptomeria japonica]XP_057817861.2 probable myosin-binding protein 6 [Cryptomeria japonica]XP_057817862.2 probable myosin-binding protein 6 [Cryptomeria japonica]XP_057817864.2 probable myosin-binding protein 6 [Cryptomeria japonica]XP_057817865.2 probable myosin-binding protein 6 [Cryptomeria japonica]GLJ47445.1 hypothetical protein SUGI_1001330 [Cryptomeria japonica]